MTAPTLGAYVDPCDWPFPYRCGRLDQHPAHEWSVPRLPRGGPTPRIYACNGHVITECQLRQWDAADDAAEERLERLAREAS